MGVAQSGSTNGVYALLFPDGFAGVVLTLIVDAWQQLRLPATVTKETPITALLRDGIRQIYDIERVHFVSLEEPITDPDYGTELGRNDLRFYPINHKRQSVFFTVECKRLHAAGGTLIGEYIKSGVMRFLTNEAKQYSRNLPSGAMLGYVLDGNAAVAFDALCKEIGNKKIELCLLKKDGFRRPSNHLKHYNFSADSRHTREGKLFSLHHILVPVDAS